VPTTVQTTAGDFTIPDYADPADVPQWLRTLVQRLGNDLLPAAGGGGFTSGKLADRPAANTVKRGALYRITGDADAGNIYVSDTTSWYSLGSILRTLQAIATDPADVPITARGAASQSADLQRWVSSAGAILARVSLAGRFHGFVSAAAAAATDVPAFVKGAASQTADLLRLVDSADAVLARFSARGQYVPPVSPLTTYGLDTAANGYRPLTITVTNAAGTVTLSTATLTYDATSGNLTRIVTAADGRTVQRDLTYDTNGNLTSSTEQITAGV
jgi:hypothetical protein